MQKNTQDCVGEKLTYQQGVGASYILGRMACNVIGWGKNSKGASLAYSGTAGAREGTL